MSHRTKQDDKRLPPFSNRNLQGSGLEKLNHIFEATHKTKQFDYNITLVHLKAVDGVVGAINAHA